MTAELMHLVDVLGERAGLGEAEEVYQLDWDRFLALAFEHQLGPLLGSPASACLFADAPMAVSNALAASYARASHGALARTAEHARVLELLGDEVVVLKGAAIAPGLYEDAAERAMSDLDLWLPTRGAAEAAARRLEGNGYAPSGSAAPHHHLAPMVHAVRGMTVELHHQLFDPPLPEEAAREVWTRRVPGALGHAVLDPVARVLHHAAHALADPIDSPLLRNLFEVVWMISKLDPGGRAELGAAARRWGVEERAGRAIGFAAELFRTPQIEGLARPPQGTIERWCRSRLEWTGSAHGGDGAVWRLRRSVALADLDLSRTEPEPLALVHATVHELGRAVSSRLFHREPPPGPWPSAKVGDGVLVEDPDTGDVHVLLPPR